MIYPADFRQKSFDHVMTNPPFFVTKTLSKPVAQGKSIANIENISLNDWIFFSLKRLKSGGSFSIIHLTERLPEFFLRCPLIVEVLALSP